MSHISDTIIRIKNASLARRKEISVSYSKLNKSVLQILEKEGYLKNVKESGKIQKNITAELRYENRIPVVTDAQIISKPSLRVYYSAKEIKNLRGNILGVAVLSTSVGILTDKEAKKKGVGGELLFRIW